jgi:hypothetical protein
VRERLAAGLKGFSVSSKLDCLINGLAEGISRLELQAFGKTLFEHGLEGVVVGVGVGYRAFSKNVSDYRNPVRGAPGAGERLAVGRRERPQPDERQTTRRNRTNRGAAWNYLGPFGP